MDLERKVLMVNASKAVQLHTTDLKFNMCLSCEIDDERFWQQEINRGRRISSWTWHGGWLYLQKMTAIICLLCTIHPRSLEKDNGGKVGLLPMTLSKTRIYNLLNAGWVVQHSDICDSTANHRDFMPAVEKWGCHRACGPWLAPH